jgi:UDPglucose 6-dehydrogenase
MTVVAYAGMTHLGLVSAAAAAARGAEVIAFDPDEDRVDALRRGELSIVEPGLVGLVRANAGRLTFTSDSAALRRARLLYIAPDVATDDEGRSDLSAVSRLLDLGFDAAASDAAIVVLSQVRPGFTRSRVRLGRALFYQVETLIFGHAVERATTPERIIVGCADPVAPLPEVYSAFLARFACPILVMRYESAELAKISINLCLAGSISVANTLAELCETIGADWSEIVPALRLDRRIGQHAYLTSGLGLSGGNLERDLATARWLARKHGTDSQLVTAWVEGSAHRKDWVFRVLRQEVLAAQPGALIGILGLAYKENTHSTKNAPALALLAHPELQRVRVFDPVVSTSVVPHAVVARDVLDAVRGTDAVAVMTPWQTFRETSPMEIARAMAGKALIDPYAVFDSNAVTAAGLNHFTLGRPPARASKG